MNNYENAENHAVSNGTATNGEDSLKVTGLWKNGDPGRKYLRVRSKALTVKIYPNEHKRPGNDPDALLYAQGEKAAEFCDMFKKLLNGDSVPSQPVPSNGSDSSQSSGDDADDVEDDDFFDANIDFE